MNKCIGVCQGQQICDLFRMAAAAHCWDAIDLCDVTCAVMNSIGKSCKTVFAGWSECLTLPFVILIVFLPSEHRSIAPARQSNPPLDWAASQLWKGSSKNRINMKQKPFHLHPLKSPPLLGFVEKGETLNNNNTKQPQNFLWGNKGIYLSVYLTKARKSSYLIKQSHTLDSFILGVNLGLN